MTKLRFDDVYDEAEDKENLGKVRTLKTETCIFTFKVDNEYGFWYITTDKGSLPDWLQGSYTSIADALKDVSKYMTEKKLTVLAKSDNETADPIDRESALPVIKYKKVKRVAKATGN